MSASAHANSGLPSDHGGKDIGVFLPIANGGWIMSSNAPKLDGSYAYNRQTAVLADELGLDFALSMAKWRGYGGATGHWDVSLDAQILIAALAEATRRVKLWTTVHTLLHNPAVIAKMMATLDQVSGGRSGLNVVTGSYKGEFDQMDAWPEGVDHDQRYEGPTSSSGTASPGPSRSGVRSWCAPASRPAGCSSASRRWTPSS
jgi:pyrimidine oxygenase